MRLTNDQVAALAKVAETADQLSRGGLVLRHQIDAARRAGASWDSIAKMLGVTRQTACRVYGPHRGRSARPTSSADALW
jgi:hypothetical protein